MLVWTRPGRLPVWCVRSPRAPRCRRPLSETFSVPLSTGVTSTPFSSGRAAEEPQTESCVAMWLTLRGEKVSFWRAGGLPTLSAAVASLALAAGSWPSLAGLPVAFFLPVLLVLLAFWWSLLHQGFLLPYSLPGGLEKRRERENGNEIDTYSSIIQTLGFLQLYLHDRHWCLVVKLSHFIFSLLGIVNVDVDWPVVIWSGCAETMRKGWKQLQVRCWWK